MRLGFHISIARGFSRVVQKAQKTKCETIQIFSRNPRGWKYGNLDPDEVNRFKEDLARSNISPCFMHLPYLPNLAAASEYLYRKSVNSLCEDLRRADMLGVPFLVVHVGSRVSLGEDEASEKVVEGLNTAFGEVPNQVMVLLENTAGQGTELGSRFEQLHQLIAAASEKKRIGICLDTAHAFQSGYDLSSKGGLDDTLDEFERFIGLKHLHLLHLNDSKTPLGSHADRHWHIGKGHIGLKGFRSIVNHPKLVHLPGIMETPRKDLRDDLKNMRLMRRLIKKGN